MSLEQTIVENHELRIALLEKELERLKFLFSALGEDPV